MNSGFLSLFSLLRYAYSFRGNAAAQVLTDAKIAFHEFAISSLSKIKTNQWTLYVTVMRHIPRACDAAKAMTMALSQNPTLSS